MVTGAATAGNLGFPKIINPPVASRPADLLVLAADVNAPATGLD
jgi:hypothetical protein